MRAIQFGFKKLGGPDKPGHDILGLMADET
jgi:hypothetical protein